MQSEFIQFILNKTQNKNLDYKVNLRFSSENYDVMMLLNRFFK